MIPPPVHLPTDAAVSRLNTARRAYPLNEQDMPTVNGIFGSTRRLQMLMLLDWLNVEHSPRYQPNGSTWCNVYATDFMSRVSGVYLPHSYWTTNAIVEMMRTGKVPPVLYDNTVTELSANGLYDWLNKNGTKYGWIRTNDPAFAQGIVNSGGAGVVSARVDGIGHVSVIVPETLVHQALRSNGRIVAPAQSQAGAVNHKFFSRAWWAGRSDVKAWAFFVHRPPMLLQGLLLGGAAYVGWRAWKRWRS